MINRRFIPTRLRRSPRTNFLYLVATLACSSLAHMEATAADTLYVNNDSITCPGTGTIGSPFCSITEALDTISGGPDTVLAVMGTGIPYDEQVRIDAADSGSVAVPFVLFARGSVTITGSEANNLTTNPWRIRYPDTSSTIKLWAAKVPTDDPCRQVIMSGRRYLQTTSATDTFLTSLPVGRSLAKDWADTVFVHFDNATANYADSLGLLCVRQPIRIFASNVTVAGFAVTGGRFDGILAVGSGLPAGALRGVTIKNCTITNCRESGIDLTAAIRCTVAANACSNNSAHGIFLKTANVTDCTVIANTCNHNADQSQVRGGQNGIRIGNGGNGDGHHAIEGNRTHHNQDSGIEMNGSSDNLLRYNQSWMNGDHGFDHVGATNTRHVGNLAYGNHRSGISIEDNADNTTVHNCVLVDNGRDITRHDFELEVRPGADATYEGNHNVIYRPDRPEVPDCPVGEDADTVLIAWGADIPQDVPGCTVRCSDPTRCFATVARFDSAATNPHHWEVNSKQALPVFVDSGPGTMFPPDPGGSADFRPRWRSSSVEAADTTVTGWRTTDLAGVARHDCSGVNNSGKPAASFADIGPYEYDDGMTPIAVGFGYNWIYVGWTATGRYGSATWKPAWFEIWVNGVMRLHKDNPAEWPGYVDELIAATPCVSQSVQVRTRDEYADTAFTNVVPGNTCCVPNCFDRPELRADRIREENADFPMGLGWTGSNPSHGGGAVTWSIPRARAGASYDLSLFDVAGRRVLTLAKGTAKAGRFTEELAFRARDGAVLPSGVFFLRLRVGTETLRRTLVVRR